LKRPPLRELAAIFLKLGTVTFGGPAAQIAMMEDELVRRRAWVSAEEFLDLLAIANLLPGPSATEVGIFIGYRLGGVAGLVISGTCFILPAFLMVTAIAWAYVRYGHLPAVGGLLYGVKPIVIAIVLQALWRLGRSAIKSRCLAGIGLAALLASLLGANPLVVLLGAAVLVAITYQARHRSDKLLPMAGLVPILPMAASTVASATLTGIFLVFLKLGSVVFGSGYVLLAFLRSDLVTNRHWLTESQLLDSVAVGQVTPGPVFTTASFIGYILGGPKGAVVATVGIFSPAFLFVALAHPLVKILRRSKLAGAVLDGLNVAALALMASVTFQLGQTAIVDGVTGALAVGSAILLFRYKLNPTWLIASGAAVGLVRKLAALS